MVMEADEIKLKVKFFITESGNDPVREWLLALPDEECKLIGRSIKLVQLGWPLGMPLVRKMEPGLWEVRIRLPDKIARVLFTTQGSFMVLLHGFIKKSQKTPPEDLKTAKKRMKQYMES
jgi:phage-related protein